MVAVATFKNRGLSLNISSISVAIAPPHLNTRRVTIPTENDITPHPTFLAINASTATIPFSEQISGFTSSSAMTSR